jgi:hypothetical protein
MPRELLRTTAPPPGASSGLALVTGARPRGASREALIVDALSNVFTVLTSRQETAHIRELRAQARSYEQAIKHWTTVPPTSAQLDAMLDVVTDLHGKVVAAKP